MLTWELRVDGSCLDLVVERYTDEAILGCAGFDSFLVPETMKLHHLKQKVRAMDVRYRYQLIMLSLLCQSVTIRTMDVRYRYHLIMLSLLCQSVTIRTMDVWYRYQHNMLSLLCQSVIIRAWWAHVGRMQRDLAQGSAYPEIYKTCEQGPPANKDHSLPHSCWHNQTFLRAKPLNQRNHFCGREKQFNNPCKETVS